MKGDMDRPRNHFFALSSMTMSSLSTLNTSSQVPDTTQSKLLPIQIFHFID